MVKHTQTIVGNLATNCLSVFDHFVGFALKGLTTNIFTAFDFTALATWTQYNLLLF